MTPRRAARGAPAGTGGRYDLRATEAKSILTKTSGFIAEAGFSHSLTPARNCTYGCVYCYVPTMRVQGGLRPEDWRRWGQFTTLKTNAASLLEKVVRGDQVLYCSPLVDPYQPAEEFGSLMPGILEALTEKPPRVFVIQTRGPLILRDLDQLAALASRTCLRVSFSLTTDRDDVRRLYEPLCAPIEERVAVIRSLRAAGIAVYATLAPLLPCDPDRLARLAIDSTEHDVIGDPFHVRSVKPRGATTRPEALEVSRRHGFERWHDPHFQAEVTDRLRRTIEAGGRRFGVGTEGFRWLAKTIPA